MRKRDTQFHLYLDKDVMDRLKTLAKEEGRTVTELLREAAADLIKKREIKKLKQGGKK